MTSAAELFYTRRSRVGRTDDEGLPLDAPSSPSLRRNTHHCSRRRSSHRRRGPGDWDLHGSLQRTTNLLNRAPERESVLRDYEINQSNLGSGGNAESSSSRRGTVVGFMQNERLPGSVLQARERLLERLRGASLNWNRQTIRDTTSIVMDDSPYVQGFRHAEAADWETETSREWLDTEGYPLSDTFSNLDSPSPLARKPPGLNIEEIKCLHHEIFKARGNDDEGEQGMVKECSICLNRFLEGENVIRLSCKHIFHSTCLYPWVQICGDCPNCRTIILLPDSNLRKKTQNPFRGNRASILGQWV
ncbi:hypothetical protein Sjap_022726 [Stephania japonica]|uniref:RING-type domain-containing protein n=1 Tax=Stephania japonica TaxID=461633 RepID=A0AAP0HT96_9MAGN